MSSNHLPTTRDQSHTSGIKGRNLISITPEQMLDRKKEEEGKEDYFIGAEREVT